MTVNVTLGSEVSKLQKELQEVRSHRSDGGRELQEELERLRQQLQEAIAARKKLEEEHASEKTELSQVKERPGESAERVRRTESLTGEPSPFAPQRVEELEEENTLLKSQKEELNQQIQQQSRNSKGEEPSPAAGGQSKEQKRIQGSRVLRVGSVLRVTVEASSASLLAELDEERRRYQNLLKEFSRLEQRYDNLKEEQSLNKVSPDLKVRRNTARKTAAQVLLLRPQFQPGHRRNPSNQSSLESDSNYPSVSTSEVGDTEDSIQLVDVSVRSCGSAGF